MRDVPRAATVRALLARLQVAARVLALHGGVHRSVRGGGGRRRARLPALGHVAAAADIHALELALGLHAALLQLDQCLLALGLHARVLVRVDQQRDAAVGLADVVAVRPFRSNAKELERPLHRDRDDAGDDARDPLHGDLRDSVGPGHSVARVLGHGASILDDLTLLRRRRVRLHALWRRGRLRRGEAVLLVLLCHNGLIQDPARRGVVARADRGTDGLENGRLEDLELLPGMQHPRNLPLLLLGLRLAEGVHCDGLHPVRELRLVPARVVHQEDVIYEVQGVDELPREALLHCKVVEDLRQLLGVLCVVPEDL
mmetsp:Transcript_12092/g.37839  ORF Transcript_12092/g.37839 Transcript_12092/m.37839 type:complete len:314 (-) Transcript_12092:398-1339(-)